MRGGWTIVTLAALLGTAGAAAETTLTVARDGTLPIPAATVRALGIKPKAGQLVCIQFPKAPAQPAAKDPHGHEHAPAPGSRAPKVFLGLGSDGGLRVYRSPALTSSGPIPGKAGTRYRAVYQKGVLVLSPLDRVRK